MQTTTNTTTTPAAKPRLKPGHKMALEFIRANPSTSAQKIADHVDVAVGTVQIWLRILIAAGLIIRTIRRERGRVMSMTYSATTAAP